MPGGEGPGDVVCQWLEVGRPIGNPGGPAGGPFLQEPFLAQHLLGALDGAPPDSVAALELMLLGQRVPRRPPTLQDLAA